ncbi:MAG: hypothetical protein Q9170_005941 [Blastenia crenularia]
MVLANGGYRANQSLPRNPVPTQSLDPSYRAVKTRSAFWRVEYGRMVREIVTGEMRRFGQTPLPASRAEYSQRRQQAQADHLSPLEDPQRRTHSTRSERLNMNGGDLEEDPEKRLRQDFLELDDDDEVHIREYESSQSDYQPSEARALDQEEDFVPLSQAEGLHSTPLKPEKLSF